MTQSREVRTVQPLRRTLNAALCITTLLLPASTLAHVPMDVSGTYANQGAIVVPLRNSPKDIPPLAALFPGVSAPTEVHSVRLTHDSHACLRYALLDDKGMQIASGALTESLHDLNFDTKGVRFLLSQRNPVEGGRSRAEIVVMFRREKEELIVELRMSYEVRSLWFFRNIGYDYAVYRFPPDRKKLSRQGQDPDDEFSSD